MLIALGVGYNHVFPVPRYHRWSRHSTAERGVFELARKVCNR